MAAWAYTDKINTNPRFKAALSNNPSYWEAGTGELSISDFLFKITQRPPRLSTADSDSALFSLQHIHTLLCYVYCRFRLCFVQSTADSDSALYSLLQIQTLHCSVYRSFRLCFVMSTMQSLTLHCSVCCRYFALICLPQSLTLPCSVYHRV